MNTVSLMIWWPTLLRVREAMFGHAKTMMVMSKVISWHKVSVIVNEYVLQRLCLSYILLVN